MVFKKGVKRCCGLVLVLSIIFSHLFGGFLDAKALDLGRTYQVPVAGIHMYGKKGGNDVHKERYVYDQNTKAYDLIVDDGTGVNTSTWVNEIRLDIGSWSIPYGALFPVSVRYHSDNGITLNGFETNSNLVLLQESCKTNSDTSNQVATDVVCTYWLYAGNDLTSTALTIRPQTQIKHVPSNNTLIFVPSTLTYTMVWDSGSGSGSGGLTEADKTFLTNLINSIDFDTNDLEGAISSLQSALQSQNQQIINQQQQMNASLGQIRNEQHNHYEAENDAVDNISDQSAGDFNNTESQQTTNLIGIIQGFLSALQNFNSASCSLTLPFPNFVIGDVTVNPCSYKEKAPTIVTVGSSLALIGFFIPLAWLLLRLIYKEIRSWTNG